MVFIDSSSAYVCGDANGDGTLNVSDAVFIVNHVFIGGPAPDPNCCDFVCGLTMTDYDGNVYETVRIGDQCWMAENLRVTHYRNGDPIPNVTNGTEWLDLTTGAYCNYNNDEGHVAVYGRLYNWFAAVDSRNIAPIGWHVPSDEEYKQLEMYLGMSSTDADAENWRGTDEGGKLKETGYTYWESPNTGATNESGFAARGAGSRYASFFGVGETARLWTTTVGVPNTAWERLLSYNSAQIRRTHPNNDHGLSIRCVRDLTKNSTEAAYVCGDANGDGMLNVSDAVFIINHVFIGGDAPDPGCCPDCPPTVTDYDGNVYYTILIGDQCWMAENLKVTHYQNGDQIPNVTDYGAWEALSTGAYCNYYNDEGYVAVYGRLYNWYAVDDYRHIAPEGWHVPSNAEWQILVEYLGGEEIAGGKMKEAGTEHWDPPNAGATNESRYTALPGGWRTFSGAWDYMGTGAYFWSSTLYPTAGVWMRSLSFDDATIGNFLSPSRYGYSVRCIKD